MVLSTSKNAAAVGSPGGGRGVVASAIRISPSGMARVYASAMHGSGNESRCGGVDATDQWGASEPTSVREPDYSAQVGQTSEDHRITLIGKPGCHLCEDARAVVE